MRIPAGDAMVAWLWIVTLAALLVVPCPAVCGAEGDSSFLEEAWPETLLAARERCALQGDARLTAGPWFAAGPLRAREFGEALFPEKTIDLDARDEGGSRIWKRHPEWTDGQVHRLEAPASHSTYLFRTIRVREPLSVEAGVGSDDGLEVFLRGQRILTRDVARGVAPDQDHVTLSLEPGDNELLLKIYNRGGGHGFYFSMGDSPAASMWRRIEREFPRESSWWQRDTKGSGPAWLQQRPVLRLEKRAIRRNLDFLGRHRGALEKEFNALSAAKVPADDPRWLRLYLECAERRDKRERALAPARQVDLVALRRAIRDLSETFPEQYDRGPGFLRRLDTLEKELEESTGAEPDTAQLEKLLAFQREVLLANPLLHFERLLFVRRKADRLGLPQNWQGNCALPRDGYDNEISILSPVSPRGEVVTLYRPQDGSFVGDVDLHFDGDRMLFSMPGSHGRWQIWELGSDGEDLRQVTPGTCPDVDNYDACYLPDGRIIFDSTRCFQGVPCVGGGNTVANLCIMNADGTGIRQLCFDQDHDWCPTVLNNGRVLYSRWEYSDSPHYFSRLLFHMNPDGTNQMEYYASNSMWPNSTFYARPIPGHPTQVIAVISGHHGVPRMGELVIFDPALGTNEANGAVQRIPGYGEQVQPVIRDQLVNSSWPKFLHPYPLSGKYFLVSCQPTSKSSWGLYLVDIFDNRLLLREEPGCALFEPVPLRKTERPPVIPDKVDLRSREAIVYLFDVYAGKGLQDVPRGTVKKLRIYEPHYAYPRMGGHIHIGIDGPWDVHRIHGTVDVEDDGSAVFRVPANTPLAVQPLDADGRALQLMRSWFTAMPGEKLSCVGCHESQNTPPPVKASLAARREPVEITPWYGPARGFSFEREVQPVLDRHCVGCHDGTKSHLPDLSAKPRPGWRNFTPSYVALHPFVRRPGPESDYFLQKPLEFHASTSELVQMLEKGHHNVRLDEEGWNRFNTWIDLNVPDHGTWHEHRGSHSRYEALRLEMRTRFANRPEDPEEIVAVERAPAEFQAPEPAPKREPPALELSDWPFLSADASRRQEATGLPVKRSVDLGGGVALDLILVPAGEFILGSATGPMDEYPPTRVTIEEPFYVGVFEVTNEQYARFDPHHDSAYISMTNKDHSHRGHPVNQPRQPVVRITWNDAAAFCEWLSVRTGQKFHLPTEAQWEWACRAGTGTPYWYGDLDTDFSPFANLADATLERFAQRDSPKWHPRDGRFNDRAMVSVDVGRYKPNPFGLHDMTGNVAEWTRSDYVPPDGASPEAGGLKTVRGGSWYDRPHRARSAFRLGYRPWQRVFNVGFRVVMATESPDAVVRAGEGGAPAPPGAPTDIRSPDGP